MRLLRWINGWRLFAAALIIFLACWLFVLGATLYEQSLCTYWNRQPTDPGPGVILVYVLIFGCALTGVAGFIWGVTGLIVRSRSAPPNQLSLQTGSNTGGRVTWLNGWRLLVASYIVGAIALLLVADSSLIIDGQCLRWSSRAAIPDALYQPVLTVMYGTVAVGLAGLVWGAISFFVNVERKRQQRS